MATISTAGEKTNHTPAPRSKFVSTLSSTNPFRGPAALERDWGEPMRLRLGANESVEGCSPAAVDTVSQALACIRQYPDPLCYELTGVLAERHDIRRENIVVDCGVDGLLALAVRTFLEPGGVAVATAGTYPTFAYHVKAYGGVMYEVPYDEKTLTVDLPALVEVANRNSANVLYIANPDNPSGTYKSAQELTQALADLHQECAVFLDEAYIEFSDSKELWRSLPDDRRIVFFRSFSKAYGLAGLRIGYAVADEAVIEDFNKVRLHFGVNLLAQQAAVSAVSDSMHLERVIAGVKAGRNEYYSVAEELGIKCLPSATNFVSFDFGDAKLCARIFERLAEHRIFVYRPKSAPIDRCIRITIGNESELRQFGKEFADIYHSEMNANR